MSTLTTRAGKGSALTHNELDANFKKAAQTKGAAYTIAESDNRDTIEYSGAGSEAFTLPDITATVAASDTGDFEVTIKHVGTGSLTISRTTGTDTIEGSAADISLSPTDSVTLKSNQAGTGVNVIAGKYLSQVFTAPTINTATLITPTITSPDIDQVVDSSGNEVHIFAEVASAVNEITETNAASGNKPSLNQTGTDNVGIDVEGVELHNGVATTSQSIVSAAAASYRSLIYQTAGSTRWIAAANSTAETGTNVGSDYELLRYDDTGTSPTQTLLIARNSGLATFENLSPASLVTSSTAGAIGTYAFAQGSTSDIVFGSTIAGSSLNPTSAITDIDDVNGNINATFATGAALSGTWQCMGTYDYTSVDGTSVMYGATLWMRIA